MIKHTRYFIIFLLSVFALGAAAQNTTSTATTSSPYSKYGLGQISSQLLPQTIAMGGISTAINRIGGYNNINVLNPASYATINFTTIDAGMYANFDKLSQTDQTSASAKSFRLAHIAFAIPVTRFSALSFGLLPYSEMGYNYKQTSPHGFGSGSSADTNSVNYIYSGQGGLSKAYLGYGFRLVKHLYVGGNVSFIFGNLQQYSSTEIPLLIGTLNSRTEQINTISGFNYDLGAQYSFELGETKHLVLGYSASLKSNLSSTTNYIVSQYTYDNSGNENVAADSLVNRQSSKSVIKLPNINRFGISFQNDGHFLVGADYTMGSWSSLTISGVNAGLQDSKSFNIGGQITPDINALRNYFARSDYRFGFRYDESYLNLQSNTIKSYAFTFGLGLPLPPNNTSFYKINVAAEIGQRGTVANGLVRENFVNIHLGFTLNDRWFQKYKFD